MADYGYWDLKALKGKLKIRNARVSGQKRELDERSDWFYFMIRIFSAKFQYRYFWLNKDYNVIQLKVILVKIVAYFLFL